jgi:LacI family transcriptional regulator
MGHKQVAVITGPLHLTNAQDRLAGFKRALGDAGIAVQPDYIQETTFDREGGYSKTLILLRMLPRPTAIFATNDMIAIGVLIAIREMGLKCPEDVSVVGFDNQAFAETTSPPLTSVHQPGYQLGTTAARILLDRVAGDLGPARHCVLQTELKIRSSVAVQSEAAEKQGRGNSSDVRRGKTRKNLSAA